MSALSFQNVWVEYGDKIVLEKVDLDIEDGAFVGLANYVKVLTNDIMAPTHWAALVNTAIYTAGATALSMLLGVGLAFLSTRTDMPGSRFVGALGGELSGDRLLL